MAEFRNYAYFVLIMIMSLTFLIMVYRRAMASLKKQLEIESKSGADLGAGHSVGTTHCGCQNSSGKKEGFSVNVVLL